MDPSYLILRRMDKILSKINSFSRGKWSLKRGLLVLKALKWPTKLLLSKIMSLNLTHNPLRSTNISRNDQILSNQFYHQSFSLPQPSQPTIQLQIDFKCNHNLAFSRYSTILAKVSFPDDGQSFFLSKEQMFFHSFVTSSGLIVWGLKKAPSVLCHLSFAANPPPISKTLPFSVQVSCARQATRGTTRLGFTSFKTSGGITVSNILEAASGAIVLTLTLRFSPYLARAIVKPWRANFAMEQFTCPKLPNSPAAEAVLMTRPYPCSLMMFQAALVHLQAPKT